MKLNLPKPYLSYSQLDLWRRNPEQYRQRYYLNAPSFENNETIFGKKIAKMLEEMASKKNWSDADLKKLGVSREQYLILKKVPRLKSSEHRIELPVGGVPFLGVLDTFSPHFRRIGEYKTGKQPWDDVRVRKHDQLVVYSLLTKLKYGRVDPWLWLAWLETRYGTEMQTIGSRSMEGESNQLELVDVKPRVFWRRVVEWERVAMAKKIRDAALEISKDYSNFQKSL